MSVSTRSNTGVGIRSTKQRTAVIEALEYFDDFRSSQEIHDYLRHRGDTVGLTTVYRTLTALAESAEHGFTDVSHTLEIFGLCADCSN
ncbi:MAG: hypothetical protein EBY60_05700 [Actinobacteria bacterium]|nr:hypothetical protein [Actinomycetota bacterium]